MDQQFLREIPSSLKQLARLVVRGFYEIEFSLIVDMLVRYPCMREDDLAEILKFDKKVLRAKLATLRSDRFIQTKLKIETGDDDKAVKVSCYYINYKIFVNVVKYKLDLMRKKMEVEERDATSRSSFRCVGCNKQFSDLEADQLFDFGTQEFRCTFCSSAVEEDESAMPKKDSRLLLAKFNQQMEKLFDLLRAVEDIKLAPEVLEPEPVDIIGSTSLQKRDSLGPLSGDMKDGKWSGEASRQGGFRMDDQKVNITFGEKEVKQQEKKEVPLWISESTIAPKDDGDAMLGEAANAKSALGAKDAVEEGAGGAEPDDEITNLLLKYEKTNKQETAVIPGEESDSDNRSDESEPDEQDAVERDAMLLAQSFANHDNKEDDVEMMDEDDDEEDDDIPTVVVGGEEIDITDVTPDIIAKMTSEEMEKYNQVYQEFYKDMYE